MWEETNSPTSYDTRLQDLVLLDFYLVVVTTANSNISIAYARENVGIASSQHSAINHGVCGGSLVDCVCLCSRQLGSSELLVCSHRHIEPGPDASLLQRFTVYLWPYTCFGSDNIGSCGALYGAIKTNKGSRGGCVWYLAQGSQESLKTAEPQSLPLLLPYPSLSLL